MVSIVIFNYSGGTFFIKEEIHNNTSLIIILKKMLGTYAYKNGQGRRFKYTHSTDGDFYFQVTHVNAGAAAIQFFNDDTFTHHIPVPANFQLLDTATNIPVVVFRSEERRVGKECR